jgi:hypothetical protein
MMEDIGKVAGLDRGQRWRVIVTSGWCYVVMKIMKACRHE